MAPLRPPVLHRSSGLDSVFLRDALVATGALVALYVVGRGVGVQALQIPAYLLIVGFDLMEVVFGSAGRLYYVLFGAYLVALGLCGAAIAAAVRRVADGTSLPAWRIGLAGALAVVAVLSLAFAAAMFLTSSQWEPVETTGVAGVVLLVLAGLLVNAFGVLHRRGE